MKDIITIVVMLLIVLSGCSKDENTSNCISFSFEDAYEYPIKPGTQEWLDLESRDARVQASMIPQQIMETISTGGLIESLLDYPFILDYIYWDKMQVGFSKLKSENKGFAEMYSRKDIFQKISYCYGSISPDCKEWIYHPFNTAPATVGLQTLEFFIFQDEFLDSIDQEKVKEVFRLIFNNLQIKIEHGYTESEKCISGAILGKIMFKSGFSPFINECNTNEFIKYFIEYVPTYRPVELFPSEVINKHAKNYFDTIRK